jgi:uncharacterized membrane protein HdeD (DUF308 family)
MFQTLTKNWWLLALCGVLDAMMSAIYVIMYDSGPDGPLTLRRWNGTVVFLSELALAAGACTIAAGIWKSAQGKSWILMLNGLALSAYGMLPLVWRGPLSFDVFALLVVVMAMTLGLLALATARYMRQHVADEWLFGAAGAASVGFALAFLALVSRWIQLERRPFHASAFLWLCLYFGFSAICMLGMALRLHSLGSAGSAPRAITQRYAT